MIKIKKPIATLKKNEETMAGPKKQPRKCNPQKMTTTKKTTKKSVKRFITPKEYDAIMDSFYKLRRKCFSLVEGGKLNDTAEKQMRRFIKGLDKAKMDVLWGRATDFLKP